MYRQPADDCGTLAWGGAVVRVPAGPAAVALRPMAPRRSRFDFTAHIALDLAEDIGTARWWRGLALLAALTALALAFWPRLTLPDAAPPQRLTRAEALLYGADLVPPLASSPPPRGAIATGPLVVPIAFAPERARIDLVAVMGAGDGLAAVLQRAGVGQGDAARAAALVMTAIGAGPIAPGTRIDLTLGRRAGPGQPRGLQSLGLRARFDLAVAVTRQGDGFAVARRAIPVDTTPLRIRANVGAGLFQSARAVGAPVRAVAQYLQTLAAHLSLDELAPGDIADFVVGYRRSAGGEAEVGDLLYAGLERDGRQRLQLLRWGVHGQFFDAAAADRGAQATQGTGGFMLPLVGRITSSFGLRFHPILGYTRLHAGVDFAAAYGTPIHAVSAGTVVYAGAHGGHGNYVRIDHGGALSTGYAHMSRIAVSPGERVGAGAVIGFVGATGLATGPHLHYEVYEGGRPVDPMAMHFAAHVPADVKVDAADAAAFKARLAAMLLVRPGAALGAVRGPIVMR